MQACAVQVAMHPFAAFHLENDYSLASPDCMFSTCRNHKLTQLLQDAIGGGAKASSNAPTVSVNATE